MSSTHALMGLILCLTVLFVIWWGQGQGKIRTVVRQIEVATENRDKALLRSGDPVTPHFVPSVTKTFLRKNDGQDQLLAALCVEVAARLRAGAPSETAWKVTWSRLTGQNDAPLGKSGVPLAVEENNTVSAQVVTVATRFSASTGAPLADLLEQSGESLGELEQAKAAQRVAFAGPSMSAKVLAALPILGLLGGQLLGANPLGWFFSGIPQMMLGVVGVVFAVLGHGVSKKMIIKASQVGREQQLAPVLCDLARAGLRGGAAVPSVLISLGEALENSNYCRVGQELLLGATWEESWTPTPFGSALLRVALQPAWEEGVSPGTLLGQFATHARRRSLSDAKEAAERLSVKLAVPLGLLLLPAFIILGLVPIFFAMVGSQFFSSFGV